MATNLILIRYMRRIVEMDETQTHLRETGSRIVNEDLHQEIMQNASRIDDLMVTMCTELRRLCAEPTEMQHEHDPHPLRAR